MLSIQKRGDHWARRLMPDDCAPGFYRHNFLPQPHKPDGPCQAPGIRSRTRKPPWKRNPIPKACLTAMVF